MKRHLVLEYRIRKLEKAILEDIDSDLDKMSDDILKKDPYVDLDAELDKNAKDIIDKEPGYFYKTDPFGDRVRTYDTIEEWLDDKTADIQLNPARPHKGDVTQQLNLTVKLLTHMVDGLNYVRRLKNYIKEISNMNVLVARQKLVSALRKRIKEFEKSNSDSKRAKDIVGTHYRTVNDWIDSMTFNNEVESEDKVTGLKYAIAHLKGMLDDQTSARFKEGGLDFGLHRAAEIKNNIEELRNTNALIANQKMVSALRKKIKELESELKEIKNKKQFDSLTYEGRQDQEVLNSFFG